MYRYTYLHHTVFKIIRVQIFVFENVNQEKIQDFYVDFKFIEIFLKKARKKVILKNGCYGWDFSRKNQFFVGCGFFGELLLSETKIELFPRQPFCCR